MFTSTFKMIIRTGRFWNLFWSNPEELKYMTNSEKLLLAIGFFFIMAWVAY